MQTNIKKLELYEFTNQAGLIGRCIKDRRDESYENMEFWHHRGRINR
jgi:hypothetical protein